MKDLFEFLREKKVNEENIDSQDRLSEHKKVLDRKKLVKSVFEEFHHRFNHLDQKYFSGKGIKVELGAGVAPMKNSYPDVLATDIVEDKSLDMVLDAGEMNLEDDSVRTIIGQNCFHHFPEPNKFFDESNRVLTKGGGIILIEPYYGPFARFLYKRLFNTEGFDMTYPSWSTPVNGPMNGANQALSYIVFIRDREQFEKAYPNLKIVHHEVCDNYLSYILSGGLNFKQLFPYKLKFILDFAQLLLKPVKKLIGVHHIIVIRKDD